MGSAPHLTSSSSDRAKAARALHSRAGRRKAGRFLVEGPQALASALDAGVVIHELFVDDDARIHFSEIIDRAESGGARVVGPTRTCWRRWGRPTTRRACSLCATC